MAKNKTAETEIQVEDFINASTTDKNRADSFQLLELMKEASGMEPKMWGPSIIGFGKYNYTYESGHSGEAPMAGFSPRKAAFSFYVSLPPENKDQLLAKFGKHTIAKSCIYFKKLEDIDVNILKEMTRVSMKYLKSKYPD